MLEAAPSAAPAEGDAPAQGGSGVATGPSQPAAPARTSMATASEQPPLVLLSGAMVAVGGGLFVVRRLAPRVVGTR
jgi:hypothetical protein